MRFRAQLVIGYTALLVVLLVTCAAAVLAMRVTTSRLEHVARDLGTDLATVLRLRFVAEQVVASSRGFLLTGEAKSAQRFAESTARLEATLSELDGLEATGMTEVEADVRSYVAEARAAAAARRATGDPRAVAPMFDTRVAPARDRLEEAIDGFVRRERGRFDRESTRAHDFAERMQGLVILATAVGVFLSIALAWLWIRKLGHRYALEREATATARRAVDARDEMLAIVSHDLRNPLATITMAASLLQLEPPPPLARKHSGSIAGAAQRMDHLIGELLDVAKLDSGKLELRLETCAVGSLFDATASLFQARANEAGITLATACEPALAVTADRERVLQVLSNLVGNAFKYTPAGGRVILAAHPVPDGVRLEVTDSGTGIAREEQAHVFERYWQARARGRGSLGLGLYICTQLVAAHHGRIGVDSEPGKGSTFWFELPRSGSKS